MKSLRIVHGGVRAADPVGTVASPAWTVVALLATDAIALIGAALVAGLAATHPAAWPTVETAHVPPLAVLLAPAAFWLSGLYPGSALEPVDEFRRLTRAIAAVVTASLLVIALFSSLQLHWPLLLAGGLGVVAVPLARAMTREWFAARPWWGVPVVVLGAGGTARLVIENLRAHPRIGLKPVACLDDDPTKVGGSVSGVPVEGPLAVAQTYVRDGVRVAVVALPDVPSAALLRLVGQQASVFREVILVPDVFGTRSIGIEARDLGGVLGLHLPNSLADPVNRFLKRCLDLALLVPSLLIAVPVVALAALAIVAVSPGPPFYFQVRAGKGGRPFRVWKLRTMHVDAAERLERHLEDDPEARREWAHHFKLTRDPRILPVVGAFLRASSLDELPQVFNILRGEMSFIGPRPFPEYHLNAFPTEFQELRATVRPGLTGLWQVSARSNGDLAVQRRLDTHYIVNWSIWMDLYVLVCTPLAVLSARGAR